MVRMCILCLMQFVLIYETHGQETLLPKYVFRVNNCPDQYNFSEWTRASTRLNCFHSLNSDETGNVYHCLASAFLNETVEFCGRSIYVTAGYCPVYNYKYRKTGVPDMYNCDRFIHGCPTQMFYSNNVRKYPSCINVNKEFGCFLEEYNCPKESTKPKITNLIKDVKTETRSFKLNISATSSPANATIDLYIDIILIITVLSYGIMLEIYLIYRFVFIGNQHLQFKIMVSEKESVTSEVRDLRLWLEKTASVHPGEILNTALSNDTELVVVTFLLKDRHANTLLKYAETNDGESLDKPNTNNKLKIATLIHHEKEIKLNYTTEDIYARQPLNEPNSNKSPKKENVHCLRKKTIQIYARNVQCDPEDNEPTILPSNQTKKKKRLRHSIGVKKKG